MLYFFLKTESMEKDFNFRGMEAHTGHVAVYLVTPNDDINR